MDNFPLHIINSVQQILVEIGELKAEIGRARTEIKNIGLSISPMFRKFDILAKEFQEHEKKVDAHFGGEIKHDKEQHFSVNMQRSNLALGIINACVLLYQVFK